MLNRRNVKGLVSGRVQGVGFRYHVLRHAQAEKLGGYVRNMADGRVEFFLQGEPTAVARVIGHIRSGPAYARVDEVVLDEIDSAESRSEFTIR
ncbi:MAG: acylphosphatase [Gammaproteobacteria bacterium]|nr:acylphosphatase [Gammaproteobacteria bacterium]